MKKFLMLMMLVLGLASLANAMEVISLNGDIYIDYLVVEPSTTVTVDIFDTAPAGSWMDYLDFASLSEGCFSTGYVQWGPAQGTAGLIGWRGYPLPAFDVYEYEVTQGWGPPPVVPQTGTVWMVDMHCEHGVNDVIITLWDSMGAILYDSATIHQIPEPVTVALLGLGALFLRRRR